MINYLARAVNPTPYVNSMPPELLFFGEQKIVAAFERDPRDFRGAIRAARRACLAVVRSDGVRICSPAAMWRILRAGTVFAGIALWLHRALLPCVLDQDSFYHLKHAWLYRTRGLLETAFPWAHYSAIRREAADLWYGFHVVLLPLTLGDDLVTGIRIGAFLVTVAALLLVRAAFALLGIQRPLLWTLLFAFVSTDVLLRLLMLRPHPLSLGLFLLLFALVRVGAPESPSAMAALVVASALVAWFHLSLSWIPVVIIVAVGSVGLAFGHALPWRKGGAILAGLAVGFLLRPNPLGAGRLAWIQVVELIAVKHLPLRFGLELLPFGWPDFVRELVPISVLLILGIALFGLLVVRGAVPRAGEARPAATASLVLALTFLVLTFTTARRACEIFVAFAVAFLGVTWTAWRRTDDPLRRSRPAWAAVGLALLTIGWTLVTTPPRFHSYVNSSTFPDSVEGVGDWLRTHARPGEIVFNVQWEKFAELFFWDEQNYYVNGMDPIFAYDDDPALYWKHHHLADGTAASTCATVRCTPENGEDTHRVLAEDFQASYVLVDRYQYTALYAYLESAPGFEKCYESRGSHVIRLPTGELAGVLRGDTLFRVLP